LSHFTTIPVQDDRIMEEHHRIMVARQPGYGACQFVRHESIVSVQECDVFGA
jgi:hypothetical protein